MSINPTLPAELPSLVASTHFFKMLFGPETNCKPRKTSLASQECAIVASYYDNQGVVRRLLVCDLPFANSAGAALSAIHPATVAIATKSTKLADNCFDNLVEVMNVAVNLFTDAFGGRLELGTVRRVSELPPGTDVSVDAEHRVRFEIAIPRYDVGRVDLIAVGTTL